jgi:ubiquinone/menaquinone biosynthesis C-methylase UbiE
MPPNTSSYFDSLARHWSQKYAIGGSLRHRIERCVGPMRDRLQPGARVLDFGCGTGEITAALGGAGFEACGFDTSPGMLVVARKTYAGAGVAFAAGDPSDVVGIPLAAGAFRGVVASSVLEYVADPPTTLSELVRILEPGGVLLMTVPNPLHRRRKLERFLRAVANSAAGRRLSRLLNEGGRAYREYLARSVNRPPVERWLELLGQLGMRVDHVSVDGLPLTIIVASKAARPADAFNAV